MAQVSVAWSLSKEGVTAPIVGTTSLDNLKDIISSCLSSFCLTIRLTQVHVEGVHVQLTTEEIKYLEEPYQPQAIFGHT